MARFKSFRHTDRIDSTPTRGTEDPALEKYVKSISPIYDRNASEEEAAKDAADIIAYQASRHQIYLKAYTKWGKKEYLEKFRTSGDQRYVKAILNRNTRMALALAKRYGTAKTPAADLFQEAIMGFQRAIYIYDLGRATTDKGTMKITSYGYRRMEAAIFAAKEQDVTILHIPREETRILQRGADQYRRRMAQELETEEDNITWESVVEAMLEAKESCVSGWATQIAKGKATVEMLVRGLADATKPVSAIGPGSNSDEEHDGIDAHDRGESVATMYDGLARREAMSGPMDADTRALLQMDGLGSFEPDALYTFRRLLTAVPQRSRALFAANWGADGDKKTNGVGPAVLRKAAELGIPASQCAQMVRQVEAFLPHFGEPHTEPMPPAPGEVRQASMF